MAPAEIQGDAESRGTLIRARFADFARERLSGASKFLVRNEVNLVRACRKKPECVAGARAADTRFHYCHLKGKPSLSPAPRDRESPPR